MTQPVIANHLRMLRLEEFISREILTQLTEGQARVILSVPEELLPELCRRVEEYYKQNAKPLTMDDINIMAASVRMHYVFRAIAEEGQKAQKTEEKAPFPETG